MSASPDRPHGSRMLVSSLLALAIGLATIAAALALTLQPAHELRMSAAALGVAALVHLLAAFAIEWTRRLGDRDNQPLP